MLEPSVVAQNALAEPLFSSSFGLVDKAAFFRGDKIFLEDWLSPAERTSKWPYDTGFNKINIFIISIVVCKPACKTT